MMSNLWFLENVNLFNKLCPHKFKEYKSCHDFDAYKKNEYIYFSEDTATKLYLIEAGKVKIGYYTEEGEEVVKAILSKGELFGEKAILSQEKRNEFAQAIDKTTSICPIGIPVLHELMRENQNLALSIYKFLNFRFKKLERRLELLLFKDARERVLAFLEDLKLEYGVENKRMHTVIVKHPYTQKDMASLIGVSRPTLNVIVNQLKEEGFVSCIRNEVIFHEKLASVS
ncbi:Crp/Fnr family transcriptional regulator [Flavicella sediminum]|uniref:Crp/Fnr family transcriptional regulator n=1 Tax=Flavicella sediminum TaxID=2585141 RepID=UPI002938EEE7|nr:Crp/Fnr family transcriptional regulator [Flavicella sediminum]